MNATHFKPGQKISKGPKVVEHVDEKKPFESEPHVINVDGPKPNEELKARKERKPRVERTPDMQLQALAQSYQVHVDKLQKQVDQLEQQLLIVRGQLVAAQKPLDRLRKVLADDEPDQDEVAALQAAQAPEPVPVVPDPVPSSTEPVGEGINQ